MSFDKVDMMTTTFTLNCNDEELNNDSIIYISEKIVNVPNLTNLNLNFSKCILDDESL